MGAVTVTVDETVLGLVNRSYVTVKGPASYDTGGSVMDLSSLSGITTRAIKAVIPQGVLHVDGAAYVTHYINADYTDTDGGKLYYEDGGTQITATTDLSADDKRTKYVIEWV